MSTPDPFAPTQLFGFPMFSSLVTDASAHRDGLIRAILDLRDRSPGVVRSNRNAWHAGDEFMASDDPHVRWVMDHVLLFARHALAGYYQDWSNQELRLGRFWANVVGPGGWNAPHHHVPSHWSGTYYVRVDAAGAAPDDMGGMIEFLNPNPIQAVWNRSGNFAVAPRDGMTLLWPASLVHFVHPVRAEMERISISYNFLVVPRASASGPDRSVGGGVGTPYSRR